jgi:CheY-like chemotaxis protein
MKPVKVLVIEDNPLILNMMQRMFESLNYKVDTAKTAAEAIRQIIDDEYQLIISDIGLPDANGIELVEEVRSLEKKKNRAPVYICGATAFDLEQYRQPCFEVGFDEVVSKPMNLHFLQHLIVKARYQLATAY